MHIKQYWIGKSGISYEFEVYPIGQEFLPFSGVYIFCRHAGDWRFEALYVGETNDFHDRLNTGLVHHDGFKRARANGATHVAVRRVAVSDCLTVETDLRHGLNPICNRQPVPSRTLLASFR